MTLWLERKEKMQRHEKFIAWIQSGGTTYKRPTPLTPQLPHPPRVLKMTKKPSAASVTFADVSRRYNAPFFTIALARFIVEFNNPSLRSNAVEAEATDLNLDFNTVAVYHRIKFTREDPVTGAVGTVDAIHVQPERKDQRRKSRLPGQFDPALICVGQGAGINSKP
jgi:hypothetical protein